MRSRAGGGSAFVPPETNGHTILFVPGRLVLKLNCGAGATTSSLVLTNITSGTVELITGSTIEEGGSANGLGVTVGAGSSTTLFTSSASSTGSRGAFGHLLVQGGQSTPRTTAVTFGILMDAAGTGKCAAAAQATMLG
jgi:hypothetical protein